MKGMGWQDRAACNSAPPAVFFPRVEDGRALAFVREHYCNTCPVRTECLTSRLRMGDEGLSAGVDTETARKLMRSRLRKSCAACGSKNLIDVPELSETGPRVDPARLPVKLQICVSCGVSWRAGTEPPPEAESPGDGDVAPSQPGSVETVQTGALL